MEGLITAFGNLQIKRGMFFDSQYCHMNNNFFGKCKCNDSCPLFGEPIALTDNIELHLCHTTLYFKKFTDKR